MDDNMAPQNDTIDPVKFEWFTQKSYTLGGFFFSFIMEI